MVEQPFTVTVLYVLGIVYALLFFYGIARYQLDLNKKYRLNYLRKFSNESRLAKVFYIVLCLQILSDTVFFFILP